MNIVLFSGGKDSTAMLLMMLEHGIQVDEIIFCDTGAEFPAMYRHINQVEQYIHRPITQLKAEHDFWYYASQYQKKRGKRIGQLGYGWPQPKQRWCTRVLKQEVTAKYLRGKSVHEFIGIAADEWWRCKDANYPLIDLGITEKHALGYCYAKGFRWEGLYEIFHRVSCWCCPLQRISEARKLRKYFPKLWTELKEMDKILKNRWKADWTVEQLEQRFARENEKTNKLR